MTLTRKQLGKLKRVTTEIVHIAEDLAAKPTSEFFQGELKAAREKLIRTVESIAIEQRGDAIAILTGRLKREFIRKRTHQNEPPDPDTTAA